jgi:hypothetical protein
MKHYSMLVPCAVVTKDFLKTLSLRVSGAQPGGIRGAISGHSQTGNDDQSISITMNEWAVVGRGAVKAKRE